MAQLDKTFPTGDCAMCILSPKLVECARNKNIEIITLADVQGISGEPGNFKVKASPEPALRGSEQVQRLRRLHRGLSGRSPQRVRPPAGHPQGDLPPVSAGHPQRLRHLQGRGAGALQGVLSRPASTRRATWPWSRPASSGKPTSWCASAARCRPPAGGCASIPARTTATGARWTSRSPSATSSGSSPTTSTRIPDRYPPAKPAAAKLDANVAIIGGGPAGLTAAYDLAMLGYGVTVFEAQPHLGGMLRYGIPSYRLSERQCSDQEIQHILDLGVEAKTDTRVADPASTPRVRIQSRVRRARRVAQPQAGHPRRGQLPACGRASTSCAASTAARRPILGANVLVIGGGDVAMDAARCARRLPGVTSVHLACLESRAEMPAHSWEAAEALEEGVVFHNSLGPDRRRDRRRGQGDRRDLPRLHQRLRRAGAVRSAVRRFQDQRPWLPTRSS